MCVWRRALPGRATRPPPQKARTQKRTVQVCPRYTNIGSSRPSGVAPSGAPSALRLLALVKGLTYPYSGCLQRQQKRQTLRNDRPYDRPPTPATPHPPLQPSPRLRRACASRPSHVASHFDLRSGHYGDKSLGRSTLPHIAQTVSVRSENALQGRPVMQSSRLKLSSHESASSPSFATGTP